MNYTVTFTQSVTGVDSSDFSLTTSGVTSASIANVSGSGTTYTVAVNTGSGSGTLRLDLTDNDSITNGTTPLGGTGNNNGNFTGGETYTIDRTPPSVVSFTRTTATPTSASTVAYSLVFSEAVTGVDATDFTVAISPVTPMTATVTPTTSDNITWTISIATTGSGVIQPFLDDNDSIQDVVGNSLNPPGTSTGIASGPSITIDHVPPVVSSANAATASPTPQHTLVWNVVFSEAVTGFDVTDVSFSLNGLAPNGGAVVSGSGTTYTVTQNFNGEGTAQIQINDDDSIVDSVGNPLGGPGAGNGNFAGASITIDNPPFVVSVNRAAAALTNAQSLTFNVTFNEPVSGVDANDFAIAATGVAGASITNVSGSGTTYSVTVDSGSGDGTVGLNFADNDSVIDSVGNPVGGAGAGNGNFTGQTYTIDKTAPAVVSIVRASANPTGSPSVNYTVTFSESVTGVDSADFTLTTSGITNASVTNVTGSGSSYTTSTRTNDSWPCVKPVLTTSPDWT